MGGASVLVPDSYYAIHGTSHNSWNTNLTTYGKSCLPRNYITRKIILYYHHAGRAFAHGIRYTVPYVTLQVTQMPV